MKKYAHCGSNQPDYGENEAKWSEKWELKMEENKQLICDLLLLVLKATYHAADIVSLDYDAEEEIVTIAYKNGYKCYANVAMDSGVAMIRDIMRNIGV